MSGFDMPVGTYHYPLPKSGTIDGFDPSAAAPKGRKDDAGKTLAGVLLDFAHALDAIAEVGTMGAAKYARGNWRHVPNGRERYMDAAMRHLLAHGKGEATDEESGLPHLAHAAWCFLAVLELEARDAG